MQFFTENYMPRCPKRNQVILSYLRSILVIAATMGHLLIPILFLIQYFFLPDGFYHPIADIPRSNPYYNFAFILYGLHYYTTLSVGVGCLSFILVLLSNLVPFLLVIGSELRLNRKSYGGTSNKLRQLKNLFSVYRSVELLVLYSNHAVRPIVIPYQTLTGEFSVFCNVTLILHWNSLEVSTRWLFGLFSCISTIAWSSYLQIGGLLIQNSTKTIESWSKSHFGKINEKYITRFVKRCRPLACRVDERYGQFCVSSESILIYLNALSEGTLCALVALKTVTQ